MTLDAETRTALNAVLTFIEARPRTSGRTAVDANCAVVRKWMASNRTVDWEEDFIRIFGEPPQ
jgi:hypothetical protein